MNWLDYREKLGIGFCDKEKLKYLSVKIFNILDGMAEDNSQSLSLNEYYAFCNTTGTYMEPLTDFFDGPKRYRCCISTLRAHCKSIEEFLAYYIALINSIEPEKTCGWNRGEHLNFLTKMMNESLIQCEIFNDEDGVFIFPKGAKELDDALVSDPLQWLENYPQARKTYVIALKQYSEGIYIRDVADNLRKALETFLQEFLCNTKNLESNKNEICKFLGEQGVDAGISGLFQPLVNAYKNINDRIAKHNDTVDKRLLEFLLYQTGVLIRMVIVVKMESSTNEINPKQ